MDDYNNLVYENNDFKKENDELKGKVASEQIKDYSSQKDYLKTAHEYEKLTDKK